MNETWDEFRNRCADTVQKIQDAKDAGTYARLYAQDVGRILKMFANQDTTWDSPAGAFEATCEE